MGNDLAAILLMPTIAAVVVLLLANRGVLSARSLIDAPQRQTALALIDLPIAMSLFLATGLLLGPVLTSLGLSSAAGGAAPSPAAMTARALLGQLLVQGPVALYTIVRGGTTWRELQGLGLLPRRPGRDIVLAVVALLAALPLVFGVNVLFVLLGQLLGYPEPDTGHQLLPIFRQAGSVWILAGLMFSAVVVAPLLEEIIFRGLVQTSLLSALPGRHGSVIVAASLLFTVIHAGMPWQVMPGLFVLALVLGWVYERSGSLWPAILLHAGFNATNVMLVLLTPP